jgi:hypothetical protein
MLEQHKVYIGLFAIILLCSGKLLKDYLYQHQIIEGMTNTSVTTNPSPLRRPPISAASDQPVSLTFIFTTAALISGNGTVVVTVSNSDLTTAGIVLPSSPTKYVATVTSGLNAQDKPVTFSSAIAVSSGVSTLTFTPVYSTDPQYTSRASQISSGATIKIVISDASISKATAQTDNISKSVTFTITGGSVGAAPDRSTVNVTVEPPIVIGNFGNAGSSSSMSDIEKTLIGLNTAITADPTNQALQDARNALIQILTNTYGTITNAASVFNSGSLYSAQSTAIDFIDKEKTRTSQNANILETDNNNKKRMSQINMYYTQNYQANTEIMKNIIYMSIALIILTFLKMKEFIPSSIATLGTIFILTLGATVIGKKIFDIMRRNDMDFDKYDWAFDESKLENSIVTQTNENPADLSMLGTSYAPCYGPGCCDTTGTVWDDASKKCIKKG